MIKELFINYFMVLLHPIKTATHNRRVRQHRLVEVEAEDDFVKDYTPINFVEACLISWMFIIVDAIYEIFGLQIGFSAIEILSEESDILYTIGVQTQKFGLLTLVGKVVFFPLAIWAWTKLYIVLITFFAGLFNSNEDEVEESAQEIVYGGMSSFAFYLFPVFGSVFKVLGNIVIIFQGLRHNLGMTPIQSLVVLVSPVIIMAMVLTLLISMLSMTLGALIF